MTVPIEDGKAPNRGPMWVPSLCSVSDGSRELDRVREDFHERSRELQRRENMTD